MLLSTVTDPFDKHPSTPLFMENRNRRRRDLTDTSSKETLTRRVQPPQRCKNSSMNTSTIWKTTKTPRAIKKATNITHGIRIITKSAED